MNILLTLTDVIFGLAELLLAVRLLLKLMGASAAAPFVQWVYATSQPLLAPFIGIFPASTIEGRFSLEFTTLFAILVYAIASNVITYFLNMLVMAQSEHHGR